MLGCKHQSGVPKRAEVQHTDRAEVTTNALSPSLNSEAISEQGSLCCPDLRIRQTWDWTGSGFSRTAFSSRKL